MRNKLLLYLIVIGSWNCGGKGTPSYEVTKMSLEEQEKSDPLSFLTVHGKTWENFIGQTVIEGDIKSSATVAKFKDVVLKINFFTKTDTHLGSQDYVLYEFIYPGQSTHFKLKMNVPLETEKIGVEVKSVQIVN